MMEFTLSRVVLSICGVAMLAAVISPVTAIYDGGEDAGYQEQCDAVAAMIDAFYESESDYMTICVNQIIPGGVSLEIEGHFVSTVRGESTYRSLTSREVISDETSFGNNDVIKLTRRGDGVVITKLIS